MHCKVIACEVLSRELYHCAARSCNTLDIDLMTQGLHDNSDTCRVTLQEQIDALDAKRFDAVLLGYGLCNNGLAGVRARGVQVVIPRAHDCITFLLGSRERYAEEFFGHPGTYYFSSGWLEYEDRGGERVGYVQKSGLAERMAYRELVAKYGEENAEFISQTMSAWTQHYTRGAHIRFPFSGHLNHADGVRETCRKEGWEYAEIEGDVTLVQDLLDGRWDAERFLVLEPGQCICPDAAEPCDRPGCGGIVRAGDAADKVG